MQLINLLLKLAKNKNDNLGIKKSENFILKFSDFFIGFNKIDSVN